MELEWAEAEIRLLPGVYACGAAADGVVVFVDPVHDAAATHDAVLAVLSILGISLPVRMLGGAVPPARLVPTRSPVRVPAAAAAMAAAAILVAGAASALTSLTRGSTHKNLAARPPATVPLTPTTSTPVVTTPPPTTPAVTTSPPVPPVLPAPATPALVPASGPVPVTVRVARPAPRVVPSVLRLGPPIAKPPTRPSTGPPASPPPTSPTPATSPTPTVVVPNVPTVVIASVPVPVVAPCAVSVGTLRPLHGDAGRTDDDERRCREVGGDKHRGREKEDAGCGSAREASPMHAGHHG